MKSDFFLVNVQSNQYDFVYFIKRNGYIIIILYLSYMNISRIKDRISFLDQIFHN